MLVEDVESGEVSDKSKPHEIIILDWLVKQRDLIFISFFIFMHHKELS